MKNPFTLLKKIFTKDHQASDTKDRIPAETIRIPHKRKVKGKRIIHKTRRTEFRRKKVRSRMQKESRKINRP